MPPAERADRAAIELRGVAVHVGASQLLSGIDLTVASGERVAVIGPSGAGKTTLLRLCAALAWPSEGRVVVLGETTGGSDARASHRLRRKVGLLHQHDNLIPGLRVAHNVLMGNLGRWSLPTALWSLLFPVGLDAAHRALQRVELGDRLWALPGELSGGEQQRVAIARLLVQDPQILLCDEPVSALDIRLGRDIVRLITSIGAEKRRTLVVSLHTLDLLTEGFDRVVALRAGRIAWQGSPTAITRDILRDVYGAEYRALHLDELPVDGDRDR